MSYDPILTQSYVRRQFPILAFQVTEDNMEGAAAWAKGDVRTTAKTVKGEILTQNGVPVTARYVKVPVERAQNLRQCMAFAGDWITYTGEGSLKVYKDSSFRKTFELIPDATVDIPVPAEDPKYLELLKEIPTVTTRRPRTRQAYVQSHPAPPRIVNAFTESFVNVKGVDVPHSEYHTSVIEALDGQDNTLVLNVLPDNTEGSNYVEVTNS